MLETSRVYSPGGVDVEAIHHRNSDMFHREVPLHNLRRMCTRTNRSGLLWILAEGPCCSTHIQGVIEAWVSPWVGNFNIRAKQSADGIARLTDGLGASFLFALRSPAPLLVYLLNSLNQFVLLATE